MKAHHSPIAALTLALTLNPLNPLPLHADGTINLSNLSPIGSGWLLNGNAIIIQQSGNYTITGNTAYYRIEVAPAASATLTLQNASISSNNNAPLTLSPTNCTVTLRIEGSNTLASYHQNANNTSDLHAAIQVEGANTSLTIEGTGSLTVQGGDAGAAIGGRFIPNTPQGSLPVNITINSGNISAVGGYQAAAIGGGAECNSANIQINGGTISATGGYQAAAIGGGYLSNANITITGGIISATGGTQAPALGPGAQASNASITISGGKITAQGGPYAAAIGGPQDAHGGNITINGGATLATGGTYAAAIGGGYKGHSGNITINGGTTYAYSNATAAIGPGSDAPQGGSITIKDGMVVANTIGTGNTSTTITGGALMANNINTTSFGQASLISSILITQTLLKELAANHATTTLPLITEREVLLHETFPLLIPVPDSLAYQHDTFRLAIEYPAGTDIIYDTIEAWRTEYDTIYLGEFIHDTIRTGHDTLWRTIVEHDTIWQDTVVVEHITTLEGLIRIYPALPTATEEAGNGIGSLRVISLPNSEGILLTGLTPSQPFAIYTTTGALIVRNLAPQSGASLLHNLPAGTYILWHDSRWSKFFVQ